MKGGLNKMAKGNGMGMIGKWAFLVGVILAVVFGIIGMNYWVAIALLVIGLIVGLLNVSGRESTPFLMSGVVLVIVAYFGQNALSTITVVSDILAALLAIFVPATVIVAIKNVFSIARN